MNIVKSAAMLFLATAAAIPCSAQVSCSAAVDRGTCASVSEYMGPAVGPGVLTKAGIAVELVTPSEFAKRKDTIRKLDGEKGIRCGGCPPAFPNAPKYREFTNTYTENAMFLRSPNGRDPFPISLLISTDEFSDTEVKDQKIVLNGRFSLDALFSFMAFMSGYFEGFKAVYFDNEVMK